MMQHYELSLVPKSLFHFLLGDGRKVSAVTKQKQKKRSGDETNEKKG